MGEMNGVPVYPAPKFHPGMDYNCRCVALPVFDYENLNMQATPLGEPKVNPATEVQMQYYAPVTRITGTTETIERKEINITFQKLEDKIFDIYLSENAKLKPKELYNIRHWLTEALKEHKIDPKADKLPPIRIVTSVEMKSNAVASYEYESNVIYYVAEAGTLEVLQELQRDCVCPENTLSTWIHEIFHWKDAEYYRKNYVQIYGDTKKAYMNWVISYARGKLEKLKEKGYNIDDISEYARIMLKERRYDEVYTEYRTKATLDGG